VTKVCMRAINLSKHQVLNIAEPCF
jgi:hypothetical protein